MKLEVNKMRKRERDNEIGSQGDEKKRERMKQGVREMRKREGWQQKEESGEIQISLFYS